MPNEVIAQFQGDYRFLSNFWTDIDGDSVERHYQAAKCVQNEDYFRIREMTPGDAKRAGREVQIRDDWEDIKFLVMTRLVARKFLLSESMRRKLIKTGHATLQEGNTWGDTYWGVDLKTGVGENNLGKILMVVREIARMNLR